MWARSGRDGGGGAVLRARDSDRAHAGIPERRVDMWEALHATFCREAKEAGTQGRPRCRTLFLGDSITEACRGTQFGEYYDELAARRRAFEEFFPLKEARAFGISGDRTQNLLYRVCNGELSFRHPPSVVVLCVGTNNLGRDNDSAEDTFLGIRAVVLEILQRLPGTRVLLTGILPRGPAAGSPPQMPPVPFESDAYVGQQTTHADPETAHKRKYSQPGVHTPAIATVNERLKALAGGSGGSVSYVECAAAFLTPDGTAIRPELMRDVLHPSAEGMRAWFAVLKPAVDALRNAPAPRDSWYEGARALGDAITIQTVHRLREWCRRREPRPRVPTTGPWRASHPEYAWRCPGSSRGHRTRCASPTPPRRTSPSSSRMTTFSVSLFSFLYGQLD